MLVEDDVMKTVECSVYDVLEQERKGSVGEEEIQVRQGGEVTNHHM